MLFKAEPLFEALMVLLLREPLLFPPAHVLGALFTVVAVA